MPLHIVFSDLDGTLLNSDRLLSPTMNACLKKLKKKKIIRVIATGRSCYSFHKVIRPGFPADYLIFSSGAGIYDLGKSTLLHSRNHGLEDIKGITKKLISHSLDFCIHSQVPENHRFVYFKATANNPDFSHRIDLYSEYAVPFTGLDSLPAISAQIIAVMPNDVDRFQHIAGDLTGYQVTRTTSPLDGESIWMEIYPENVTKGSGALWLCNHLGVDISASLGIGNDYNDIDLLECTKLSYVTANAPDELKRRYRTTRSNDQDGLYHALREVIGPF